jgi:hypothetical protein
MINNIEQNGVCGGGLSEWGGTRERRGEGAREARKEGDEEPRIRIGMCFWSSSLELKPRGNRATMNSVGSALGCSGNGHGDGRHLYSLTAKDDARLSLSVAQ